MDVSSSTYCIYRRKQDQEGKLNVTTQIRTRKKSTLALAGFSMKQLASGSLLLGVGLMFPAFASAYVSITMTPLRASLTPAQTVTLATAITGTTQTGVTWSAPQLGTLVGSGANAVYTAPTVIARAHTLAITAKSVAAPTKTAAATLTLIPLVTISLTPRTFTLDAGSSQQLSAVVTGNANTAVTWTIQPPLGSINSAGLYTAPASVASAQPVPITPQTWAPPPKPPTSTLTLTPLSTFSLTPSSFTPTPLH